MMFSMLKKICNEDIEVKTKEWFEKAEKLAEDLQVREIWYKCMDDCLDTQSFDHRVTINACSQCQKSKIDCFRYRILHDKIFNAISFFYWYSYRISNLSSYRST